MSSSAEGHRGSFRRTSVKRPADGALGGSFRSTGVKTMRGGGYRHRGGGSGFGLDAALRDAAGMT